LTKVPFTSENRDRLLQKWGNTQPNSSRSKQTNLELSIVQADHSYCRTSIRLSECGSGLRVQKCHGLQRLETKQYSFQQTLQSNRYPQNRSLCLSSISTTSPIHVMEGRSLQSGRDAFQIHWDKSLNYAFPPFCLIGRVLAKLQREKSLVC